MTALGLLHSVALASGVAAQSFDTFASGLTGWTVQSNAADVTANPGGDPVIQIDADAVVGQTLITYDALGVVAGDFDIAVSLAGSSPMSGMNVAGLVFGYTDATNYFIAAWFPGFAGGALRISQVIAGVYGDVPGLPGSNTNFSMGFSPAQGDANATTVPDAIRVSRVGDDFTVFSAQTTAGGWVSRRTWTDATFPGGRVGFGEAEFDIENSPPGFRFGFWGEGTDVAEVLSNLDKTLALSLPVELESFSIE